MSIKPKRAGNPTAATSAPSNTAAQSAYLRYDDAHHQQRHRRHQSKQQQQQQQQQQHRDWYSTNGADGITDGPEPDGTCLKLAMPSFCTGTVCPYSSESKFKIGTNFSTASCVNGDRTQLFAAYTLPTPTAAAAQSLIPLTWAVSAYVGNGLVGVRVQSEEGGVGVLHVILDNVMLGAMKKRQPTGYFRMTVADPAGGPYTVSLRQHLATSTLEGNVTDAGENQENPACLVLPRTCWRTLVDAAACCPLFLLTRALLVTSSHSKADGSSLISSFSIFVNANLSLPVVVLTHTIAAKAVLSLPPLPPVEWVSKGSPDFAWVNTTNTASPAGTEVRTVLASVQNTPAQMKAADVVAAAAAANLDAVYTQHAAWWAAYWAQAFVTLPVTRLESFYFVEMYRFAASDRVVLQGLMGAFGPTDNYNLWGDDVWDMNEQVMYWIGAASNRPQITNPLETWVENGGTDGGLWMLHNYVKQVEFEGNNTKLSTYAWDAVVKGTQAIAGATESEPGRLTLRGNTYHLEGCSSPEYKCYPPFQDRMCTPKEDCNYELSQLRWGLVTALKLTAKFKLESELKAQGVDIAWWQTLIASGSGGKLAWYPYDDVTGFRLDTNCAFECPHRHFSHLLQIYDLETVHFDESKVTGNATLNTIMYVTTVASLLYRSYPPPVEIPRSNRESARERSWGRSTPSVFSRS